MFQRAPPTPHSWLPNTCREFYHLLILNPDHLQAAIKQQCMLPKIGEIQTLPAISSTTLHTAAASVVAYKNHSSAATNPIPGNEPQLGAMLQKHIPSRLRGVDSNTICIRTALAEMRQIHQSSSDSSTASRRLGDRNA